MRRVMCWALILVTASFVSAQQSEIDEEHTKWIDSVLRTIDTIKPGMTRKDLSTVFVTEGGISTRLQRTYVYRQCPFIKVTVQFEATNGLGWDFPEMPNDKIVKISRPFLQYSVMD
jgi:hypothetical protein